MGSMIGSVIGGAVGGPIGASIGGALGGAAGSAIMGGGGGGEYQQGIAASTAFQQQSLIEQLKLGREAMDMQMEMFDKALQLGEPYRDAGSKALSHYESMIYGIPIDQTASYMAELSASREGPQEGAGMFKNREEFANELLRRYAFPGKTAAGAGEIPTGTAMWADIGGLIGTSGQIPLGVTTKAEFDPETFDDDVDTAWIAYREAFGIDETDGFDVNASLEGYGDVTQAYDWQTSPSYDFRREEGQKAIERSASASSGLTSGAQLKAIERYGQDMATLEYDNILRRLGGLVDTGANMASLGAGQAISTGTTQANILSGMSNQIGEVAGNVSGLQVAGGKYAAESALGAGGGSSYGGVLSGIGSAIQGYGAGQGWWGGLDPNTGITWNSGRQ